MSSRVLKPHRGSISTMSSAKANLILQDGELFMEKQSNGSYKFKVGDGVTVYSELPYSGGEDITGNATVSDVLSGKTFCSANGKDLVGTYLPRTGTATASDVLSGKTFSNSTSNNLTGTIPTISKQVTASDFMTQNENGSYTLATSAQFVATSTYVSYITVDPNNIFKEYAYRKIATLGCELTPGPRQFSDYDYKSYKPSILIDTTTYYPAYCFSSSLFTTSGNSWYNVQDSNVLSENTKIGSYNLWRYINFKTNIFNKFAYSANPNKLGVLGLENIYVYFNSSYRALTGTIFAMVSIRVVDTPSSSSWYGTDYYDYKNSFTYYNGSSRTPLVTFNTSTDTAITNYSGGNYDIKITGTNQSFIMRKIKVTDSFDTVLSSLKDKCVNGKSLVFCGLVGFTNTEDRDWCLSNTTKCSFGLFCGGRDTGPHLTTFQQG